MGKVEDWQGFMHAGEYNAINDYNLIQICRSNIKKMLAKFELPLRRLQKAENTLNL